MIACVIQFSRGDGPRVVDLPELPRVGDYVEYGPSTVGRVEAVAMRVFERAPFVKLSYVDLTWYQKEMR